MTVGTVPVSGHPALVSGHPALVSGHPALVSGHAAAVVVVAAAVLAVVLVRPPGMRVLTDRLTARPPLGERPHPPRGTPRPGPDPAGPARTRLVIRVGAGVFTVSAVVLAAGTDLGGAAHAAASAMTRSGLLGASPALAMVVVVAVRARRRSRRRRVEVAGRARLIRGTEALLADLRAGASPLDALAAAAAEVPELVTVAAAVRLGGDVPTGLAALAGRPGLSGLAHLAAVWAVSAETGSSLTGTLDRLVDELRDAEEVRQETDVALATPRATARLLAALPAAGLGLGTLVGADPWGFLTGSGAGAAIATVGALLAGIGLEWVEVLADRVQRVGSGGPSGTASGRDPAAAARVSG